jgi:hypothetical protein
MRYDPGMAMDYGIFLAPFADSWKIVKRAEALGYRRAWFYDTQLLNADLFVSRNGCHQSCAGSSLKPTDRVPTM